MNSQRKVTTKEKRTMLMIPNVSTLDEVEKKTSAVIVRQASRIFGLTVCHHRLGSTAKGEDGEEGDKAVVLSVLV